MLDVNEKNFMETAKRPGVSVIYCWAPFCGTCKEFTPVFEEVASRFPDYSFAKLDTLAEQKLAYGLEVPQVPALMIFRDGKAVFCQSGTHSESGLEEIFRNAGQ